MTNYPLRGERSIQRAWALRYYCNGILATRCDSPAYPATAQRTPSCATDRVALSLSLSLSHGTRSLPPQARSIGRLSCPLARGGGLMLDSFAYVYMIFAASASSCSRGGCR